MGACPGARGASHRRTFPIIPASPLSPNHFYPHKHIDMDLDLSEPESPILDYARTHGLSRDYALESPFYGVIPTPADDAYDEALRLPIEATYQPSVHILLRERLAVNKDTAILLKEVLSGKQALVNDEDQQYRAWKEVSGLKLERPLLSTDSELDLLEFGSTKEPDLNDLRVPLDSVDEENDEGLCWPSSYLRCPEKCFDQINSDKIRVSKEVLVLLQDTVTDPWTTADDERVQNEIYGYKRVSQMNRAVIVSN